MKTFANW